MTKHDELSRLAQAKVKREHAAFEQRREDVYAFHGAFSAALGSRDGVFMVPPSHTDSMIKHLRDPTEQLNADEIVVRALSDPRPQADEQWRPRTVRGAIILALVQDSHGRRAEFLSAVVEGRPGVDGLALTFRDQSATNPDPAVLAATLVQWMEEALASEPP